MLYKDKGIIDYMKKAKKIVFFVVLAIVAIAGIATFMLKKMIAERWNSHISEVLPGHTDYVQWLSGYVRCIYFAEESGMEIDESVKDEISDFAHTMHVKLEKATYESVSDRELMLLLYIYSYYDLDYSKIKDVLEGYYIPEEKLFNGNWYTGEDSIIPGYVSSNIEIYRNLRRVGADVLEEFEQEGYELEEGLVEWFNAGLPEANTDAEASDLSDYYCMLHSAYDSDLFHELNCEPMRDMLSSDIDEIRGKMDAYTATVLDISTLEQGIVYSAYISQNSDEFVEKANLLHRQIASFEGFGYDIGDDFSLNIMSYYLKDHYAVCGSVYNDFLNENLSTMIHEHFEKYCEGNI